MALKQQTKAINRLAAGVSEMALAIMALVEPDEDDEPKTYLDGTRVL